MTFIKRGICPNHTTEKGKDMDTFDAISKRSSIRSYLDKPLSKELLEKLVDAGRQAPTARCVEPWEFIIITQKANLQKISDIATNGKFIKEAQAAIAIFCEDTKYYLEDGCAATENILLQASDLGLGACWIAGDKKPYCDEIADMLSVPKTKKLISIISLGWPAEKAQPHKRRPLEDLLHWEKF